MSESIWHVWMINVAKHQFAVEYIQRTNGIDDYVYPVVQREYTVRRKIKIKDVPLYGNYIFIKCNLTDRLRNDISNCKWMGEYIGPCSNDEINRVKEMNGMNYSELVATEQLSIGSLVKLRGNSFKYATAQIIEIDGDKITVSVPLFGADRIVRCTIHDIEIDNS